MTIKQALAVMSESSEGVLLMVNNDTNKLLGMITERDLRQMLLATDNLQQNLIEFTPQPHFFDYYPNAHEAMAFMDEHGIDHIPIVNHEGMPVSLVRRKDLAAKVLLSVPHLGEQERHFVAEAFSSNWIAPLGPNVDAFETELAEFVGVKAAAALSSGTAAIHLALRVLDVGPDDDVFCSSLTFVASANPILYQHAILFSSTPSWTAGICVLLR